MVCDDAILLRVAALQYILENILEELKERSRRSNSYKRSSQTNNFMARLLL